MQCYCQKCGAIHDVGNRKSVWWKYAPPCRYCGGKLGADKKSPPKPKLQTNGCPLCNGVMVVRRTRDGGEFLGCKKYPACKGSRTIHVSASRDVETVLVTDELLQKGASVTGAWSRAQLRLIGVEWPPKSGWRRWCVGRPIAKADAERFVELASVRRGKVLEHQQALPKLNMDESLEQWRERMTDADTSTEPPFDIEFAEVDREFLAMFR